eukprot:126069_1
MIDLLTDNFHINPLSMSSKLFNHSKMKILVIELILLWFEVWGSTFPVAASNFIFNGELVRNMHWIVIQNEYYGNKYLDAAVNVLYVKSHCTDAQFIQYFQFSMAAPLHDANPHVLPRDLATYHGQTTVITHQKKVKRKKEFIQQQFRLKIEIIDDLIYLFIQKDGQRSIKAKKQSEIRALTKKVIRTFLVWMGFADDMFEDNKMTKPQIVEFTCAVFNIPTTETLKFEDEEVLFIGQYLIEMHSDMHEDHLVDYIQMNHTNMNIITDIIMECEEYNVDILNYLSVLWLGLIDNFYLNRNDDDDYREGFELCTELFICAWS